MNKALLPVLSLFLLVSCSDKITFDLDGDKAMLKETEESELTSDVSSYFACSFTAKKSEENYRYTFTLDQPKKEYHSVRVLISTMDDMGVFFFGYDGDYSLVSKEKTDTGNLDYAGINIFFSSSSYVDSLKCRFASDEETVLFKATLTGENQ